MEDRELYKQKLQAQLDQLKGEIDVLKAKARGAKADANLDLNALVRDLEAKARVATDKLVELSAATEESWDSIKRGVESARDSLKASFHEAMSKFKS